MSKELYLSVGRRDRFRQSTVEPPNPALQTQDQGDVVAAVRDAVNVLYTILKRLEGISHQLSRLEPPGDTQRANRTSPITK